METSLLFVFLTNVAPAGVTVFTLFVTFKAVSIYLKTKGEHHEKQTRMW